MLFRFRFHVAWFAVFLIFTPAIALPEETDLPAKVKALLEFVDQARTAKIAEHENTIKEMQERLEKTTKNKPRKDVLRRRNEFEKQRKAIESKLETIKRGDSIPIADIDPMRLKLYEIGPIDIPKRLVVNQVIDKQTMLVYAVEARTRITRAGVGNNVYSVYEAVGNSFLLTGVSTVGRTDGETIDKLPGTFAVTKTVKYDTAAGGTNTVFVVELFDVDAVKPHLAATRGVEERDDKTSETYRTWVDDSGKYRIRAKLVKFEADNVTLEKRDGSTVVVPLDKLSKADRSVVKRLQFSTSRSEPRTAGRSDTSGRGIVYTFSDQASFDHFEFKGDYRLYPNDGGLELLNGKPASAAMTKATFSIPISIEYEVFCLGDGTLDIFPGFGPIVLAWGINHNKKSAVYVNYPDYTWDIPHRAIEAKRTYRVKIAVDEKRVLDIHIDDERIFKKQLDDKISLAGPIRLSGGIGHVVYKRVTVK